MAVDLTARIWFARGWSCSRAGGIDNQVIGESELFQYDPSKLSTIESSKFVPGPSMLVAVHSHSAISVNPRTVVLLGGTTATGSTTAGAERVISDDRGNRFERA